MLHLPADQSFTRPESALERMLYDCPDVPVGPNGACCRVVVATHPANAQKRRVGHTRRGIVYELFFTNLPQEALHERNRYNYVGHCSLKKRADRPYNDQISACNSQICSNRVEASGQYTSVFPTARGIVGPPTSPAQVPETILASDITGKNILRTITSPIAIPQRF